MRFDARADTPERRADERVFRIATQRLATIALVLFIGLAVWMMVAPTAGAAERWIDRSLSAPPGSVVFEIARGISFIGSSNAVIAMSAVLVLVAWRSSHRLRLALFCLVAPALAGAGELVMKQVVGRSRPATSTLTGMSGFGFPSGHTAGATAVAVVVASLASLLIVSGRRCRRAVRLAVLYAFAVGVSRVVVGAHQALDVIGGWLFGVAAALMALSTLALRPSRAPVEGMSNE